MKKKVLICPLDWGLGHASRDIKIIEKLLEIGFEVIIGADCKPLLLLQEHFPNLSYERIPFPTIKYPLNGRMAGSMLWQTPKIIKGIIKEHLILEKIVKKLKIDIVISDNRFGLWNRKTFCVFISHQLWIKSPKQSEFTETIINKINHWFIKKYDKCWIPDELSLNIAGELSVPKTSINNTSYIGLLSRFSEKINDNDAILTNKKYDILVILSGLEPQRTVLEKLLCNQIAKTNFKTLIIGGLSEKKFNENIKNIEYLEHLSSPALMKLIKSTKIVICRAGYSSIMDLIALKKTAILIPTPGQPEQDYLAKRMISKKWFYSVSQDKLNVEEDIKKVNLYSLDKINVLNLIDREVEILHTMINK